ncbi:unnamed protein product [Aspergillus oryzae]|uniref:Unnamed protein product n=1 Tax=Aspergillus oryzae TaxID=5062 RepID=A0AAN5BYN0_ASPOZ|nr:unnamed protein product [Aspergillus oryzae]GMF96938.1 unnamed protein product [Aspergillus oryzae]GMG13114.1 unnamed protein product [Aspergillus oryzae]GMG30525.1 unnamed protein product [Aspergillus oryzae]
MRRLPRFERERAVRFYTASRLLIDHHIRLSTQSNSLYAPHSKTMDCTEKAHFKVLQAQIILTTLGTWGNHDLLHDSLGMAGQMALYLRDSGLLLHDFHSNDGSWSTWIQEEGQRRTKFIAYMICNNQTILYNMPPKILNSEVSSLYLPWPEELWSASTASEWKSLRSKGPHCVSFGDGYGKLFHNKALHRERVSLSSFGNLVLIHGLFQHIYLAWEASFCIPGSSKDQPTSIPVELLTRFHTALRRWQKSWETSSDPSITPISPKEPLGFNATAIFRIACIRLHFNLGPHRSLGTGDPEAIASAFCNAPRPAQTPKIYHAVLQSIHALSIPVRIGVEYVARTQTLTWSTIHSLFSTPDDFFNMSDNHRLDGKVALVTGAGRGIGAAIAVALGERGAKVVVNYAHSREAAEKVVEQIKANGTDAIAIQADVGDPEATAKLMAETVRHFGYLDIVSSNAGIVSFGHLKDVTPEGVPKHAVYSGSKGAIDTFVRCMAIDCGDKKITVNAVAPGAIKTDMFLAVSREYIPNGETFTDEQVDEVSLPPHKLRLVGFLLNEILCSAPLGSRL